MKRGIFLVCLFLFGINLFAQKNDNEPVQNVSVKIDYGVFIKQPEQNVKHTYNRSYSVLSAPLNEKETRHIVTSFLQYLQSKDKIINKLSSNRSSGGYFNAVQAAEAFSSEDYELLMNGSFLVENKSRYQQLINLKDSIKISANRYIKNRQLVEIDSSLAKTPDGELMETIFYINESLDSIVSGVTFYETWCFDAQKGIFRKDIHDFGLARSYPYPINGYEKTIWGLKQLFDFEMPEYNQKNITKSYLFKENVVYDVRFDGKEYIKHVYDEGLIASLILSKFEYYIVPSEKHKLLFMLFKSIKDGNCQVFATDKNDKPTDEKIELADLQTCVFTTDTIQTKVFDNEEEQMEIIRAEKEFSLDDIIGFTFYEDWYLDVENFGLYKDIKGISLIIKMENPDINNPLEMVEREYFIRFNTEK